MEAALEEKRGILGCQMLLGGQKMKTTQPCIFLPSFVFEFTQYLLANKSLLNPLNLYMLVYQNCIQVIRTQIDLIRPKLYVDTKYSKYLCTGVTDGLCQQKNVNFMFLIMNYFKTIIFLILVYIVLKYVSTTLLINLFQSHCIISIRQGWVYKR